MIFIWNGLGCLVIPVVIVGVMLALAIRDFAPNQPWLQLVAVAFTSLALLGLGWLLKRRPNYVQDNWGNRRAGAGGPLPLLGPGAILVRHRGRPRRALDSLGEVITRRRGRVLEGRSGTCGPGLCVIANGGFACMSNRLRRHAAGPEDRHLARLDLDRVAEVRLRDVANADRGRVAEVDRRAVGPREPRSRSASPAPPGSGVSGRIDTTIGPREPARRTGTAMFVRYIGTFTPCSMCRTGTPAASRAFSNVNEQPITNDDEVVAPVLS